MTIISSSAEPAAPSSDTASLTRSAGRGAMWQIGGGMWQTVVRLAASTVLARVLAPNEFAIMGMAILAREFILRISAFGIGISIIAKKDVTQDDLSTAFWVSAALQATLFAASFAGAPLAAAFFRAPELTWVMRAICSTFLLTAMSSISGTLLTRRLQFRYLTILNAVALVIESALAVVLAVWMGLSYWALVLGCLAGAVVLHGGLIAGACWRPGLRFSRESFRYQFRFGLNQLGTSVTTYLHQNIDYILAGRMFGTALLGLYEFAYRIPHLLHDRLARPTGTVVFPTLSKAQHDDSLLAAGYVKAARYIALATFPLLLGLAATSRTALEVLWGPQWLTISTAMQLLCIRAMVCCISNPLGSVFLCKKRPDIPFKFQLATLIVTVGLVAWLGWAFGLNGIAAAMLLSVLPNGVMMVIAFRLINSPLSMLWRGLWPATAAGLACGLSAGAARAMLEMAGAASIVVLMGAALAGACVYCLVLWRVFPQELAGLRGTAATVFRRKDDAGPARVLREAVA